MHNRYVVDCVKVDGLTKGQVYTVELSQTVECDPFVGKCLVTTNVMCGDFIDGIGGSVSYYDNYVRCKYKNLPKVKGTEYKLALPIFELCVKNVKEFVGREKDAPRRS